MVGTEVDFCGILREREGGRRQLAVVVRDLAGTVASPDLDASRLSDECLFEPRVFAWHFGNGRDAMELSQLVAPGLRGSGGPIAVKSDAAGAIFVSGLGHLDTNSPNTDFRLLLDGGQGNFDLATPDGRPAAFAHRPSLRIPGTAVELVQEADPVIKAFWENHIGGKEDFRVERDAAAYMRGLAEALRIIGQVAPSFHGPLVDSLRSVVLFRHTSVISFAALGLHGMLFLNVCRPTTLPFFIDGFVHQGGHVVFREATIDRPSLFKIDPDTQIHVLTGGLDKRSIYDVLHGLFTEHALVHVFHRALRHGAVTPGNALELSGRAALTMKRFESDLAVMGSVAAEVFSPDGTRLFDLFSRGFEAARRDASNEQYDLSGQPAEFDLEAFLASNKIGHKQATFLRS